MKAYQSKNVRKFYNEEWEKWCTDWRILDVPKDLESLNKVLKALRLNWDKKEKNKWLESKLQNGFQFNKETKTYYSPKFPLNNEGVLNYYYSEFIQTHANTEMIRGLHITEIFEPKDSTEIKQEKLKNILDILNYPYNEDFIKIKILEYQGMFMNQEESIGYSLNSGTYCFFSSIKELSNRMDNDTITAKNFIKKFGKINKVNKKILKKEDILLKELNNTIDISF